MQVYVYVYLGSLMTVAIEWRFIGPETLRSASKKMSHDTAALHMWLRPRFSDEPFPTSTTHNDGVTNNQYEGTGRGTWHAMAQGMLH